MFCFVVSRPPTACSPEWASTHYCGAACSTTLFGTFSGPYVAVVTPCIWADSIASSFFFFVRAADLTSRFPCLARIMIVSSLLFVPSFVEDFSSSTCHLVVLLMATCASNVSSRLKGLAGNVVPGPPFSPLADRSVKNTVN